MSQVLEASADALQNELRRVRRIVEYQNALCLATAAPRPNEHHIAAAGAVTVRKPHLNALRRLVVQLDAPRLRAIRGSRLEFVPRRDIRIYLSVARIRRCWRRE
jgi:hypothetical protein